jgi:type VI secretion system VasI family protein
LLKTLAVQIVLTLIAGPMGLAYTNLRAALIATGLTLAALLVVESQLLIIWAAAVALSAITGVCLIRATEHRQRIDQFQLSTYVGSVSRRVIKKGRVRQNYQIALSRFRLKKKLHHAGNTVLVGTCFILAALIVNPHWIENLNSLHTDDVHDQYASTNQTTATAKAPVLIQPTDEGFILKSSNFVTGKNGPHRVLLNISCNSNKTALSISSDNVLGTDSSRVILRLNNEQDVMQSWKINRTLTQASVRSPISTLRRIASSEQVSIHYQPFGSNDEKAAVFDIQNIRAATASVRKRCHC